MPSIEHIITSNETMHNNKACEPIALIGMSCTFAGGIDNPDSLWEVLKNSVDVGSEIPKERFDINSFASRYHINKPLIRRGYFVNENQFDHFDASFFGITDGEAMKMDPCHRLLLEKFVHLIEDADYTIDKIRGTRTSVHIGQFSTDHSITYNRLHVDDRTDIVGPNLFVYNASARIAYHFNLHGPNVTLDTACSSSFQAIHLAVQALRNGEADFAVAGGVNLHYTPESFIAAATTGAISPDGRSRTYSEDANGYAIGEGVGLVLLKRLSDAIRDKDRIYCVVRDIMANHDGNESKISYSVPSPYGQNMLLNEIFTRAKIDPNTVFYIEAHGTGTQVGDPIEANTLGAFFHRSQYNPPLLIGSVKSNIGHTEGAAGVASLIKVALCMKHRILTPNMHFTRINPKIHAKKYNLHIVNHTVQFSNDLVTIGINSFGMGGNNSHAIITEWSEQQLNKYFENDLDKNTMLVNGYQMNGEYKCENTKCSDVLFVDSVQNLLEVSRQHFVLTFSSTCNQSMKNQIERFHAWFSKVPVHLTETYQQLFLAHLCAKLLLKRTTSFSHRLSFIFSNFKQFQNQINSYLLNDNNCPGVILPQQYQSTQNYMVCNICFVYGGQGPQWWLMGRQLYSTEPVFRQWIDKIHLELLNVSKNSFSLIQELINTENEKCSRINDTNIAQPAIFAIQVALTALWLSWGIRPKVLIGHSVGEIAAAFVGGRLTLKEATKVIYHRSRLQHRNSNKGGRMLAVNISEDELHKIIVGLADRVEIAAINSPQSLTLSGDGEILEKIYDILITMKPNTFKAYLKTENAFHSRQMERFNIHEELIQSLSDIKGDHHNSEFNKTCSDAILYSSVTGAVVDDKTIFNAEYWWKNIRDTVLFKNAIQSILTDINPTNQIQVFLEISPHPVLSTAITECFTLFSKQELLPSSLKSPLVIHSLNRKEPEQQMMLTSLCRLFSAFGSHSIDLNTFWNSRSYSKLITTKKYNDKILKLINFYIDQLPNYAFSRQVCWSEPKDSVFIRRALRKQDHPLLGYRLWQNEARTPTWKNVFTINNSNQYAYLLDHNIQGTTLFPASGFIELAVAAVNQLLFLLSSQQQSIAFENIQFLNGLILKEDESVQIETVIIMPFREFFIYSRRKYSNDCLRLDGISGNDIITVFSDQKSLHAYSSTEWTLHSCGSINLKIDTSLISSMYNFDSILHNFSSTDNNSNLLSAKTEDEIKTLYAFFLACGLHYGPSFKTIKTLHRTQSEVLTEIEIPSILLQDQNADQQRYHLNPSVLDGCFQGLTTIIPYGDNEAFIPVGIEKLIIFGGNKGLFETAQEPNRKLYAFHTLNLSIKGTTPEKAYTDELVVFSSTQDLASSSVLKTDPIAIFQGFKIQQIPTNKVRSKPIFQKIEESIAIGNTKSVNVKELVDRFCARTYWKQVEFVHDCLEVLSDPILLLNNTPIEVNNDNSSIVVKKNNNQTFEEFVSSIPFINELSAQYIIIFLKKLLNISFSDDNVYLKQIEFRSKILAQHYNLMNSFMNILQNQGYIEKLVKQNGTDNQQWKFLDERVRDVRLINEHTIKISLVNLLNKCPQLKSILSLVELCGSNLCEIVTGKIDELQSLFGLENEILLQELISVISEDNTQSMFSALCQQIKNKISQNKDNNWVLKILEIEAGYGRSTIHILTILNDLANSTNTRIEYTFTNTSSDLFAKTKQTFDELIEEKNIKNQINITHQVFDPEQNSLSSSSVGYQQHLLNPESFHIIFGSNILNKTSNVVNCVRNIRQLLAPGGILLLNEINTCLLPYFKFIFGLLFSSWKFSSDNSAEQVVIMSEIFNQTNGFDQIHCASPNESVLSSFIIQKSNSQLILNDLSERQQQQWIIFCDHKQKVGKRLANLLSQNKISNRNITLVYLSLEEKQNQNCSSSEGKDEDSINYIKIHNTCSISSDIRNIIQRNNVSRNSLLHIVFAWPLDLAMLDDNIDDIDKFKNIFQYQEEIGCGALMYLIQSIYETKFVIQPNIFVLTQNSQPVNNSDLQNFNLTQSPVIGFARSLINEYTSNRLKLIDIQSSCLSSDFVNQLIKEMFSTISCSPNGLHDEEVVLSLCENTNVIQRWLPLYAKIEHPKSLTKSDMKTIIIPKRDADCVHFKLQVPESRFVSDLKWTTSSFESSNAIILSPTEVEVKVHCVGINFRDILKARGLHPHASDGEMDYDSDEVIGSDFSGIITRIGSNVNNNLKINDQIFGLTLQTGAIKSHIILDQNLVVKASPNFTMEQLCTLPTPFVTVIYCLRDCAHLQKGQTILIHAASGAVGLAAIQYCRMIGANVIVTAGTEKKRNFLREKYEIKHVFNSRNLSFITDIRQIAPNGVNVIINSLTGDFLQESIKLLAPAGHFIEIGKRDIYANGRLSLFPLRMSCSFHVVDLTTLQKYCPGKVQELLQYISQLCTNGILTPIAPMTVFEPSQIQQAVTIYSQATHMGKFVVRITDSDAQLEVEKEETKQQHQQQDIMFSDLVCNRGTVVISGGLGGVAIDMSRWMIKKRAVKRIVLLSRRNIEELKQNSSQLNDLMNLIQIAKRHNASVEVMKADVTELDQVVEVIRRINENSKYPVRGIIHSAMVLHDCLLATMTQEMLSKVMQPKVCGAWNLHYATKILSCPISFFIMLSSIRNHMSDVGQSNYTAGNNFLDAIAHWRFNCKNLPALSVSLPAISGAGYIHKNPGDLVQTLQSKGIFLMPAVYVFKMIEQLHFIQQQQRIIKTDFSSPIMFVLNWKPLLSSSTNFSSRLISIAKEYMNSKEVQEEEAIIGHINNVKNQSSSLLSTLDIDIDTITNKIRLSISKLFGALSVDRVDLDKPLIHQGMDSLVAVEICNWLGKEMSVTGPLVELLQGMSINELASYVRAKLHSRQTNVNVELNNNKINESLGIETDNDNDTNSLFNVENNDIIESQTRHTGTSLIIPLHHSSFRQLLFCIHDMIGRPQTFNQLALKISQVYQNESPSIFAFRASGYESDEPYIQSVEMIAEEYILQMKRMQPTGPYNLVGYSFGGLIAYEMARQLYNYHGETVRSLILIDPPVPANENLTIPTGITENQYWSFGALGFIYSYLMLKENSFYHSMDEIMKSKVSEQQQKDIEQEMMPKALQALKQRFYPLKDNDVDSSGNQQHSTTEKMFQIIKTQYKAINHYTYSSAIDLNRSEIGKNAIMFTLNENNNSNSSNAKTNVHLNRQFSAGRNENIEQKHQLWENLLPNLKIEVVPGSHYTVLQPPFVDLIVQKLITLNIL